MGDDELYLKTFRDTEIIHCIGGKINRIILAGACAKADAEAEAPVKGCFLYAAKPVTMCS